MSLGEARTKCKVKTGSNNMIRMETAQNDVENKPSKKKKAQKNHFLVGRTSWDFEYVERTLTMKDDENSEVLRLCYSPHFQR